MKREDLAEVYQLNSLSYLSPVDHYFRVYRPTDFLKGAIIDANTIPSGLQRLVSPYSVEEFKNTFKRAGREDIFNAEFLEMKPCGKKIYSTKEFVGVVRSMSSGGETTRQKIGIIHVGNPLKVNHTCKCDKKSDNWFVRAVWHRAILNEWRIPEIHDKYYQISTCPHVCAGDFYIRRNFSKRIFGIRDGFDIEETEGGIKLLKPFMKPYILAYKEALDCAPKFPGYVFDTVLTHHTRFFDNIKRFIDWMRGQQGMKPLDINGIGNYLVENFVHSGYSEDKINELIRIFSGL